MARQCVRDYPFLEATSRTVHVSLKIYGADTMPASSSMGGNVVIYT